MRRASEPTDIIYLQVYALLVERVLGEVPKEMMIIYLSGPARYDVLGDFSHISFSCRCSFVVRASRYRPAIYLRDRP